MPMTQPLREDLALSAGPDATPAPTKADEVAAAVAAAPGVAALSEGRLGGVSTPVPGRCVTGVVVREGDIEVHVIGRYGVPAGTIAAQVRRAAEPFASGQPVHVIIEDLA
jgi:hypothetical protein